MSLTPHTFQNNEESLSGRSTTSFFWVDAFLGSLCVLLSSMAFYHMHPFEKAKGNHHMRAYIHLMNMTLLFNMTSSLASNTHQSFRSRPTFRWMNHTPTWDKYFNLDGWEPHSYATIPLWFWLWCETTSCCIFAHHLRCLNWQLMTHVAPMSDKF